MTHYMMLSGEPFYKTAEGKKKIELRLFDEKRKKISVGDILVFERLDLLEPYADKIQDDGDDHQFRFYITGELFHVILLQSVCFTMLWFSICKEREEGEHLSDHRS